MSAFERTWLALLAEPPDGADATAEVREPGGAPAGWLAAWRRRSKPVREALRVDPRAVDPDGPAGWISLVLPPRELAIAFDDAAVQHARRLALADPRPPALRSTLLRDDSHFAGAITAVHGDEARTRLLDDPFGRVHPARVLRVGPGLLGTMAAPAGPVIERYGSANPWPWDAYGD